MAKIEYPIAEYIRQILEYCPDTGTFTWRHRDEKYFTAGKQSIKHNCSIWNGRFAGKTAGNSTNEYHKIRINDTLYLAHRIAWIHYYGHDVDGDIDHINMNTFDNRIMNLRVATRSQNMANTKAHKDSMTGVKGVYLDKRRMKYNSRIFVQGKSISLGAFTNIEDAKQAYILASKKYFGQYQRSA